MDRASMCKLICYAQHCAPEIDLTGKFLDLDNFMSSLSHLEYLELENLI